MRQSNVMKAVGGERMFNMQQHSVAFGFFQND